MQIITIPLSHIQFEETCYPASLYESMIRIGLNFPIHVSNLGNDHYQCVEGHKRLSVIKQILQEQPEHPKFQMVRCILHASRTPAPDFLRNHH